MPDLTRRSLLSMLSVAATVACGPERSKPAVAPSKTTRTLGRTGVEVEPVSLGGEGSLRTKRSKENDEIAIATIVQALQLGVRYCDTAPAYEDSQDYYGEAFARMPGSRARVFLASKTHLRERDASLALLDQSLTRLRTDHLDLWQLHDLRDGDDLEAIFAKGGAIEAIEAAKKDGRVKFAGITGHHHPEVLVEAMKRYSFDTVLCAINPSDPAHLPFVTTVVREARARGVGVIAMKIFGRGRILEDSAATIDELVSYAASIADTAIVGCMSPSHVRENLEAARRVATMSSESRSALEARLSPKASRYAYYKSPT